MQNFSERLEMAIERSKRPKGELAVHCGVALSTVSRWLAGSVPKVETLEMIAEFLGVEAKWLVFGGDAKWDDPPPKWRMDDPAVMREEPAVYGGVPKNPADVPTLADAFEQFRKALDALEEIVKHLPKEP